MLYGAVKTEPKLERLTHTNSNFRKRGRGNRKRGKKQRSSMAGSIKGYYRQRKSGVSKSSSKSKSKPKSSTKKLSKAAQPSSLDIQGDYDENEELLRRFDMNMAYGPCIGMTRLDRWERANGLGLDPPKEVRDLLRVSKVGVECLWYGCV